MGMAMPYSVSVCFLFEKKDYRIPKINIYVYIEGLEEFKGTRYYSALSNAHTHFSMVK